MKIFLKRIFKFFGWLFLFFAGTSLSYTLYLKWFQPFNTPLMLTRSIENKEGVTSHWLCYDSISDNAKAAVIGAEDPNFIYHHGFDFEAIQNAFENNLKGGPKRGASTISQQVAKNVFLWQDRSWLRKGLEVWFTVLIETFWGKKRILEVYLNVVETGKNTFGFNAAAQLYYKKNAGLLTLKQAVAIASILPNPNLFTVKNPLHFYRNYRSAGFIKTSGYLEKI